MTKKMTGVQLHNSLLYEPVFPIAEAALPLKSIWYNQNVLSRVDLFPEGEQTGFGGIGEMTVMIMMMIMLTTRTIVVNKTMMIKGMKMIRVLGEGEDNDDDDDDEDEDDKGL